MNGRFELLMYNVERGCSIWMSTPGGANLIFDLGRSGTFSPLMDMYNSGVRLLDAVFVTHPHVNHFSDIAALQYFNVARFFRLGQYPERQAPLGGYPEHVYYELVGKYLEMNRARPMENGSAGENAGTFNTRDGVVVELFQPSFVTSNNVGDYGLVAVVLYNGVGILLSGDNGIASWDTLLRDPRFVNALKKVNVCVAPCHGGLEGFSEVLKLAEHLDICLSSDGYRPLKEGISENSRYCTGKDVTVRGNPMLAMKSLSTSVHGNIHLQASWERDMFGRYKIETY